MQHIRINRIFLNFFIYWYDIIKKNFSNEKKKEVKKIAEHKSKSASEITKLVGELWNMLAPQERQVNIYTF